MSSGWIASASPEERELIVWSGRRYAALCRGVNPILLGYLPRMSSPFARYVALGDSSTEGLDDPLVGRPGRYRGWADRLATLVAAAQARHHPDAPRLAYEE